MSRKKTLNLERGLKRVNQRREPRLSSDHIFADQGESKCSRQSQAVCLRLRGVWRGVQRATEAAGEARDPGRHQDPEGGLHRAAEARFPVGGVHHGPVQPSQHHPPGGRGHQE